MESFVIEPCKCNNCMPIYKKEEEKTTEEKILDYLFDDIQRQIRVLKIQMASFEKSYFHLKKLMHNLPGFFNWKKM